MINIADYLTKNKHRIARHNEFKLLFKHSLSIQEVSLLSNNLFIKAGSEPMYASLFNYTHHILFNNKKVLALCLQCTDTAVYIQSKHEADSITLSNNTIIYYIDNYIYLVSNRIVTAIGIIKNDTISWSNTITFDDCYMDLPKDTILPEDNKILPMLILNNFQKEGNLL